MEAVAKITPTNTSYAPGDVRRYGAVGTGSTDDSSALRSAFKSGANVFIPPDFNCGISTEITCAIPNITVSGGGKISFYSYPTGGNVFAVYVSASGVSFTDIAFDGSQITSPISATNIAFIYANYQASGLSVSRCKFTNLPFGAGYVQAAVTTVSNLQDCGYPTCSQPSFCSVTDSYFSGNPGSIFFQGANCIASGNRIASPHDSSIVLNGPACVGCVIVGNTITNSPTQNVASALIAVEEAAAGWVIADNNLMGVYSSGISALNVNITSLAVGGVIKGNVINGGGGTAHDPIALINVSPNYQNVLIENNQLYGLSSGVASSALIVASVNGGTIRNNYLDSTTAGAVASNVILCAGSPSSSGPTPGLTVEGNVSVATGNGRHYLFLAGNYGSGVVSFEGGKTYGGSIGIDAEFNVSGITNLTLYVVNLLDNTATTILSAATLLGSRSTFLRSSWRCPRSIKVRTDMYGSGIPTTGTWYQGDVVRNLAPIATGAARWHCTFGGTPGTWTALTL